MYSSNQTIKQRLVRHTAVIISVVGSVCACAYVMLHSSPPVLANMSSASYEIDMGNFNITSGEKSSTSFTLTDTVGQTAPGQFGLEGYVMKSGFQYIYADSAFEFTISNTNVDFGIVTPGAFSLGQTTLTVTSDGSAGYAVYAQETHPLINGAGTQTILDTTCDLGTCSELVAGSWATPSNTGFGYTASGTDVVASLNNGTAFKQFADASQSEPAQILMQNTGVVEESEAIVTYKLSIPGNQPAGEYETIVIYTATPGY